MGDVSRCVRGSTAQFQHTIKKWPCHTGPYLYSMAAEVADVTLVRLSIVGWPPDVGITSISVAVSHSKSPMSV